jgi:hypothetical protein
LQAAAGAKLPLSAVRLRAWCCVLDALGEQKQALAIRIERANPDDKPLEADVRVWCHLANAAADFLEARRA